MSNLPVSINAWVRFERMWCEKSPMMPVPSESLSSSDDSWSSLFSRFIRSFIPSSLTNLTNNLKLNLNISSHAQSLMIRSKGIGFFRAINRGGILPPMYLLIAAQESQYCWKTAFSKMAKKTAIKWCQNPWGWRHFSKASFTRRASIFSKSSSCSSSSCSAKVKQKL